MVTSAQWLILVGITALQISGELKKLQFFFYKDHHFHNILTLK